MATQECLLLCHLPLLYGVVCYGYGYLFAPVRHPPGSWYARHLEKPSSPHLVLAGLHAGPLPRAQNFGRTGSLDFCPGHRVALSPLAQGELLACASTGGVVGPGSAQYLAAARGWAHPSCR